MNYNNNSFQTTQQPTTTYFNNQPTATVNPPYPLFDNPTMYHGQPTIVPPAFPSSNAPNNAENQLQLYFSKVDRDRNGCIDRQELRDALSQGGWTFDEDVVRMLIEMFDRNGDHMVDFPEFCQLHNYLMSMKRAFNEVDIDKNGFLDFNEVERAITKTGMNIGRKTLFDLFNTFDVHHCRSIGFDGYIKLCIYMGMCRHIFEQVDTQKTGRATMSMDTFMDLCLLFTN